MKIKVKGVRKKIKLEKAQKILKENKIRFASSDFVNEDNINKIKLKFPVVAKINSEEILHKSDLGGIITNIKNKTELKEAYKKIKNNVIRNNPNAKIKGISVQKEIKGNEYIIGMKRDPQFGPVILFGLGGIFVELIKDYALRICPVDENEAIKMIKETKAYTLMQGIRGSSPDNIKAVIEIIVKLSNMVMEEKYSYIKQIDFNPVIANQKEAKVVDIRMLITK